MDKLEELTLKMEAMEKAAADKAAAEQVAIEAEVKATQDAEAKAVETKKTAQIEIISTGVERLEAEVSKRMENDASVESVLNELRSELKENKDELIALRESKMQFATSEEKEAFSADQKSNGYLLGKIMRTGTENTKFYKDLVEKAARHGHVATEDWETTYNTEIYDLSQQKLVVANLFDNINMVSATMQIPTNPGASTGEWITSGSQAGTGTAATAIRLGTATLTAHKLVSKEYLPYEEEEDAIMAILPIVKGHIAQRIANSTDSALLTGVSSPINGLVEEASATKVVLATALATVVVQASDLQAVRRKLGMFGQNPSDVTYIVSTDVYYDLMEDSDFKNSDVVTNENLMQIKGFVGSVNGSPVIVSDKFEAKAINKACAVAVATPYFKKGTLRGLMTETFRDIEAQKSVIVSSTRFGFINLESGSAAGKTVAQLAYKAS
ncbi:MAG TPA: phage major capsid protein [Candidatus Thioglobus sp.]|nr:phage major capsid protein [Candidatus Thioglobus sp.]